MRVLLVLTDVYSATGGGQVFYRQLIRANPEFQFFYFSSGAVDKNILPSNVTAIQIGDHYRSAAGSFLLNREIFRIGDLSLAGKEYDILYLLDLAASVFGMHFDIIDIPDFMPFAAFFPYALRHVGVSFEKISVAMHGTLSWAVTETWSDTAFSPDQLEILGAMERLLYNIADIRYGIGKFYMADWEKKTGNAAHILDATQIFDLERFSILRAKAKSVRRTLTRNGDSKPDVAFIGRQEKCKGPDLFVDLVTSLPRAIYEQATFIGPEVTIGGVNSWDELTKMANRRGIEIKRAEYDHSELLELMTRSNLLAIFPSRRDTFNLAALEAILCGMPTAIASNAGVCAFLDQCFPNLPYVKFDLSQKHQALFDIGDALSNYLEFRDRLDEYLTKTKPARVGNSLVEIFSNTGASDQNARLVLDSACPAILVAIERSVLSEGRKALQFRLKQNLESYISPKHGQLLQDLIDTSENHFKFRKIFGETENENYKFGFLSDDSMEKLSDKLTNHSFSTNRVYLFSKLAEFERRRGNELLYATYQLRVLRLSGRKDSALLSEISGILERSGFSEEAHAARMMYGNSFEFDQALAYLLAGPSRLRTLPCGQIESVLDHRRPGKPKVSVIVSLYRAAKKIPNFLNGIRSFTESGRRAMELVLVDSNSPDDTSSVVKSELEAMEREGHPISTYYLRTSERETIQKAWNRGIEASRGDYLAFLGADEMNRADALEIMASYLDRNPNVDWVQGSAVVTDVDAAGMYVRDVMEYDRKFDNDFMQLFDTCYLGYVGGLYRRSVHDRAGFYDDSFRAAGDTEFKNRALPHMKVVTLPEVLGFFLNYPEIRTTQSPTAELEDLRAWYLHRSPAGIAYQYRLTDGAELKELFHKCLSYKKSYSNAICTDLELGSSVAAYMKLNHAAPYKSLFAKLPPVEAMQEVYRALDDVDYLMARTPAVIAEHEIGGLIEDIGYVSSKVLGALDDVDVAQAFGFRNDNRAHQHHNIWHSESQKLHIEAPAALSDLAGCKDLAEVLSSCGATDERVDFESAWRTNKLSQVKRLFEETSLDIAVEAVRGPRITDLLKTFAAKSNGSSLLILGALPEDIVGCNASEIGPRIYWTGDVVSQRPALVAARVVAIPALADNPRRDVTRLVRAISLGKPVVADENVVSAMEKRFEGIDFSALATASNLSEIFEVSSEIAGDDRRREELAKLSLRLAQAIARHPACAPKVGGSGGVGHDQAAPMEWNNRIEHANRLVRDTFADGGSEALLALKNTQSDEVTLEILFAFLERLSPQMHGAKRGD